MPDPLPSDVVATLKTDACAALAAIMIIANAHSELLTWAHRTLSPLNVGRNVAPNGAGGEKTANQTNGGKNESAPNGAAALPAKRKQRKAANPRVKPGHGAYNARQRAQRDADDERLIEAMGQEPGASIGDLARELGKSRGAIQAALHRLRDRGLAQSDGEQWRLIAQLPPSAKWIEPLSCARVARHAADGRVRGELGSMAAGAQ